ncbi:DUF2357 domain-containing protein [Clostridium botulinum]|nr:DUF2357 domain-containing protein [Clostridium botulinum]MBO0537979.1 DUF2357 domain-containing protein [Clostridium botulinum]MBO0544762.1 DUF2357 domain-containing protein [Clostridium botulinum]MBO0578374.1 DUF2357 domain-containing protein [Clostridium botulinum]
MDYQKDYYDILLDVNEEIYNLSFEFLKRTYLNVSYTNKEGNSLTEYYSILITIFNKLINSINIVINRPHHILHKEEEIVPYHKIRKVTRDTVKWLNKNSNLLTTVDDKFIPKKALQVKKSITLDTRENRLVKHIILSIIDKLNEIKNKYNKLDRKKDTFLIDNFNNMINKLKSYLNNSFLTQVGEYTPEQSLSLVIQSGAGYKDIYKYYLILKKGLTLNGEIFKLSMKNLALLYEYWCFIKINSILRKKYKMIKNDIIKVNTNGIFVTLKKGQESKVTYINPKNGEKFTIAYNKSMKSETGSQKPDNIFSIEKERHSRVKYSYIFDAKYRLNYAKEGTIYKESYINPGPQESDINAMHRYRDAIIYSNKNSNEYEREIFGAFVLFPYNNEEEYKNHNFYKSIDTVNIGGIPLLPSSTKLLEKFLDQLVNESSYSSYERSPNKKGNKYYLKDSYFDDRIVLVGALKSKDQLEINLKNRFYHTALSNVNLEKHSIKTIAIAQSKTLFKEKAGITYCGRVKDIKIVARKEIKEIPKNSEELYLRFEVYDWKKLNRSLKVEGYQVRKVLYTTEYLLNNSEVVTELLIKSKEEFRIWKELKRMHREIKTILNSKSIGNETRLSGFSINNMDVYIDEDTIKIINKGKICGKYTLKEFRKYPTVVVKNIRDNCKK